MKKLKYGVAINDADYQTSIFSIVKNSDGTRTFSLEWRCPFYKKWEDLIARCYSEQFKSRRPTYVGCSVCEEWLTFSNFKSWMETQDWRGKVLDKDFLSSKNNKVYSPETCVFIDPALNSFILDSAKSRGKYLQGVDFHKHTQKFRARCGAEYLGLFETEKQAHEAWRKEKIKQAEIWADKVEDLRLKQKLKSMYKN